MKDWNKSYKPRNAKTLPANYQKLGRRRMLPQVSGGAWAYLYLDFRLLASRTVK